MQIFKFMVSLGDSLMAIVTTWFMWKNARDVASEIGFTIMAALFIASAVLIWR